MNLCPSAADFESVSNPYAARRGGRRGKVLCLTVFVALAVCGYMFFDQVPDVGGLKTGALSSFTALRGAVQGGGSGNGGRGAGDAAVGKKAAAWAALMNPGKLKAKLHAEHKAALDQVVARPACTTRCACVIVPVSGRESARAMLGHERRTADV